MCFAGDARHVSMREETHDNVASVSLHLNGLPIGVRSGLSYSRQLHEKLFTILTRKDFMLDHLSSKSLKLMHTLRSHSI